MNIFKQVIVIYQAFVSRLFKFYKDSIAKIKKTEARYYFNSRQKIIAVVLLIVMAGVFMFVTPAGATVLGIVISMISWICYLLIMVFGWLLTILINILISIAQYNGFINAAPVETGWIIVRNICNMFFVVVLLVIAFGTVLGIETYNYKKTLRKLIVMAFLINFSKTITAVLIDASQILMLTFVNAFKNAGYNFVKILGIEDILSASINQNIGSITVTDDNKINEFNVFGAVVLGLILIIVSTIVVLIFVLILIVRIVFLWLLMVLSPLAFFLMSFPDGQRYASKWWDTFIQQLIIGPLLAFFLWLSLATAQGGAGSINIDNVVATENESVSQVTPFATKAGQPANLLSFMIAIIMMVVGLSLAQEIGGVGGQIAGKGLSKLGAIGTGKLGPTPMRWARERAEAFKGKATAARKGRATMAGEGAFARFEAAKGKIKAGGGALAGMTVARTIGKKGEVMANMGSAYEKIKASPTTSHQIGDYSYEKNKNGYIEARDSAGKLVSTMTMVQAKRYYKKAEKKKAKQNLMEAVGQLDDKKVGDQIQIADLTYEKLANGGVKVSKGSDVIMTKSGTGVELMQRYNQQYGPAQQIMDDVVKKKIDQKTSDFSNLSAVELRRIMTDTSSSKNDKMAASMLMLAKEAFKDKTEFKTGKEIISSTPSLAKQWDESADKRFALWNNSDKDFQKKVENGTVDITKLDTSQLNQDSIKLVADITGIKFKDTLKKMDTTKADNERITKALKDSFEPSPTTTGPKADLSRRRAYAALSGDVSGAVTDSSGGVDHTLSREMLSSAKADQLDLINDANLNDSDFKDDIVDSLNRAQLKGLQRLGSIDQLTKILKVIKERGSGSQLETDINDDAELKSIYDKL